MIPDPKRGEHDRLRDDDVSVTRSEEQLEVGTRDVETGRARLEKDTVTEQRRVSGEVRKERVDVERDDEDRR